MRSRIDELVDMAYDTGHAAACMEYHDPRYVGYAETHERNVEVRNAARDALEADITALVEAAKAAYHDLTCPQQDQYYDTPPALRKALAAFEN